MDERTQPDFGAQLLQELDSAVEWPLARERKPREAATQARALRKGERDRLRQMHGWDPDREYKVDNLARRIAFGWADFLFAEDVTITAAADETEKPAGGEDTGSSAANAPAQAEIDHTLEVTRLPALLHRMERIVVSEGEAYWKLHVNRAVADTALLTFNSRLDAVPLFYGELLLAVAFVTERHTEAARYRAGDEDDTEVVFRHAEIHSTGRVQNVLYRGTREELGHRVDLTSIAQTAGYAEEWPHQLPMLAGRVVNDLDDDPCQGVGEYDTILDQLLDLNEAVTIAAENARLTGKDRIFSAGRFMQADGSFDASLEVFQVETDEHVLGGEGATPIVAVEKKYDAAPLWLHITNLVKTAVNRVGLVPQWIGEDLQGHADTGVAIRLRFIPTTNAAKGKTREWAHVIPTIVDLMLQVASLPVDKGGFGRKVAQGEPPAVEFADPLPTDTSRDLLDVSAAVSSEVMSRQIAIATLHPEWSDDQVDEEIERIEHERQLGVLPPEPGLEGPVPPVQPPRKVSGGGGSQ